MTPELIMGLPAASQEPSACTDNSFHQRCTYSCCAVLCYAMLCYAILCCAVLCYIIVHACSDDFSIKSACAAHSDMTSSTIHLFVKS